MILEKFPQKRFTTPESVDAEIDYFVQASLRILQNPSWSHKRIIDELKAYQRFLGELESRLDSTLLLQKQQDIQSAVHLIGEEVARLENMV